MRDAMFLKHAAQMPFLRGAAALFLCWLLLHIFTISWELPHTMPPEPDGISPKTSLNARGMMAVETFKYPPLQYLLVDALTPDISEKDMTLEQILENRTLRLKQIRWLTAVMEYLTALLILLFSLKILNLSPFPAFGAALSFLLLPPVLYYSQTTNMDIPYTFWFFASLTSAAFAERAPDNKKAYAALSLLTGFLIACAFCTKDQVYALYLLPAAAFAVWRFRRFRKWSAVLLPFLLWLCAFLPGTVLFYLCIGKDTFLPHLKWITGEGSIPYAIVSNTLAGRCRLIPIQLADLGSVLDLPLLLYFLAAALLLFPQRKLLLKDKTCVFLVLATALVTLSLHLFLCQVVRYTYLRFLLPLLPFYTMLAACLLQKSAENRMMRCARGKPDLYKCPHKHDFRKDRKPLLAAERRHTAGKKMYPQLGRPTRSGQVRHLRHHAGRYFHLSALPRPADRGIAFAGTGASRIPSQPDILLPSENPADTVPSGDAYAFSVCGNSSSRREGPAGGLPEGKSGAADHQTCLPDRKKTSAAQC